jgi:DNA recombination protein RmuC
MSIVVVLLCLVALAAGGVIGWLAASARGTRRVQIVLAERELAAQDALRRASAETQQATAEMLRAMAERDGARDERERSELAARSERERSEQLVAAERGRSEIIAGEARQRIEDAERARAVAETRLVESHRALAENRTFVETSRKQFEDTFAALSQKTLQAVSENLVNIHKLQLEGSKQEVTHTLEQKKMEVDGMLKPLAEMLASYRGELTKSEHVRNEVYGGLQEQIRNLLAIQEGAQREAARLATALTSPTVSGAWGESSLKRCIELAGMSEFCDFKLQETFSNEEGRRLRPDCIVNLPNKRVIAIDSKAPTQEYIAASNETDDTRKREWLALHAKTIRRHIEALSRKEYQLSIGDTLDFTVMFLPGEHFLSAALVTDPEIFEYAVARKIYLASPTVLLPLLRAVAAGWKAERTEENAKRMHDAGVELFNRFVTAMEKINAVGGALQSSVKRYNEAIRSIDTRLWPKGEEMQRMAGSGKELGTLEQIDVMPMESTKFRLTMQDAAGHDAPNAPVDPPRLPPIRSSVDLEQ